MHHAYATLLFKLLFFCVMLAVAVGVAYLTTRKR